MSDMTEPLRNEMEAFAVAWNGRCEVDGFNALIVKSGLRWRQALVLRAYARYMRQVGSTFSQKYLEDVVIGNADITRLLIRLFETRFDPRRDAGRAEAEASFVDSIEEALDSVPTLDQDRILRTFLAMIKATLRTNYFQVDDDGNPLGSCFIHQPILSSSRPSGRSMRPSSARGPLGSGTLSPCGGSMPA